MNDPILPPPMHPAATATVEHDLARILGVDL